MNISKTGHKLTLSKAIAGAIFCIAILQIYIYENDYSSRNKIAARSSSVSCIERSPVPLLPRINRRLPLPPLESLLNITNNIPGKQFQATIIGNVSDLLDFAVIGVAKCGTSTMMGYLNQPPLSYVFQGERCAMGNRRPENLIQALHRVAMEYSNKEVGPSSTLLGIKCPSAIGEAMDNFSILFPRTKFIVGLRHPVHWFQSFYNYRTNNEGALPHPLSLTDGYINGSKGVFANRVRYHFLLARLGKTPLTEEKELSLVFNSSIPLERQLFFQNDLIENKGQKVFLYHVEQLSDDSKTKDGKKTPSHSNLPSSLVQDLSNFLGLDETLHPVAENIIPGKVWSTDTQAFRDSLKINICDAIYKPLRKVLVDHGRTSAQWIREYFLQSPDVFVPSGKMFDILMDQWTQDPCDMKETTI